MTTDVRVLLVDDNKGFRRGLRLRLDLMKGIQIIGEAGNGRDAVTIARAEKADVVLMDLEMPGMDGIEATRQLSTGTGKKPAVIVLTSHLGERHVIRAIEAGAAGYLVKTQDRDQMADAIFRGAKGETMIASSAADALFREIGKRAEERVGDPSPNLLSPAERRVVVRLSRGLSTAETIADDLGLSANTVRSQLRAALIKTKFADKTQLAVWALRHGVTTDEK